MSGFAWQFFSGQFRSGPVSGPKKRSPRTGTEKKKAADQASRLAIDRAFSPGGRQNFNLTPAWIFQRVSALLTAICEEEENTTFPFASVVSGEGLIRPSAV